MSTAIFGDIKRMLKVEVVTQLPDTGKSNKLYFVLNGDTAEENRYDEYIWVKDEEHPDGYFELVGYKYVDLSPYYTKTEVDNLLSKKVDLTEYNQFKETTNQSITNLETKLDGHIEDFNDQVNTINSLNNTVNSLSNTVASHDTKFWNLENDTIPELQNTDSQLNQEINTLTTNLNNEISSRTSQDLVLQANIDTVSSNLNDEITARTEADSNLQSQITNITTVVNSKADVGSFKTINGESIEGTGDISIDLTLYRIVSSLPTTNIDNTKIYLVVNTESEPNNEYIEYIYVNNKWEELGKYKAEVDLSPYYNKTEVDAKLDTKLNITDAENTYVSKEEGKGLSTNDFNNTYKSRLDWIEESNTVSTLINIPCTRRLVIANIAVSETMSISADILQGRELHIIIKNTSDTNITITLPTDSRYINIGGTSFIITPYSYAEVNIISNGTIFYVRFKEYPQDIIMTIDSNPEVMAIMWKNGLCASPNYMLKSEAEAVTDEQLQSDTSANSTSLFYASNITHFEEFKYFTAITRTPVFSQSTLLKSIVLPNNITNITAYTFNNCKLLESVLINEGVTTIDTAAFQYCDALTSVNIPDSCTLLNAYCFASCINLTSINLNKVQTTGNYCFSSSGLTSIHIPETLTSISTGFILNCNKLASVTVDENNTIYDSRDNCNAIIQKSNNSLKHGCNVTIIPDSVKTLDTSCFRLCTFKTISIPEGVNYFATGVFMNCPNLETITLPSTLTTMVSAEFAGCSNLKEIKFLSTTPPSYTNPTWFGTEESGYTGRNTYDQGINKLIVPEGATGYDQGQFLDPLCNPNKCGFTLYYDTKKYIEPSKAVAGDYCLYDKQADKLIIVQNDKLNADDFPLTDYTPVGVIVIPGSHDVYGTGQCGVMSLVEMDCDTPDTGSTSYHGLYFGNYNTDISALTNFNVVAHCGKTDAAGSSVIGTTSYGYLPCDRFSRGTCPNDTNAKYYYKDSSYYALPSPYLTDGSRNSEYYKTVSPSSSFNALSDFNGIINTTTLINLATGQSDWKTASTITNKYNVGYFPAACCCWRFHTDGTKQGDWYLPACGELGYMVSRIMAIENAISKITTTYGSSYGVILEHLNYGTYLSSSERDSSSSVTLGELGGVSYIQKYGPRFARAFIRV